MRIYVSNLSSRITSVVGEVDRSDLEGDRDFSAAWTLVSLSSNNRRWPAGLRNNSGPFRDQSGIGCCWDSPLQAKEYGFQSVLSHCRSSNYSLGFRPLIAFSSVSRRDF